MADSPTGTRGRAGSASDGAWLIRRAMSVVIERAAGQSVRRGGGSLTLLDIGGRGRPYADTFARAAAASGRTLRHLVVDPGSGADVVGVAESLPFPEAAVDLVLSTQVLEHVEDPWRAVAEMARVLRPDGTCLLTTHGTWFYHPDPDDYWRWTSAGLARLFARAGFAEVNVSPVGGTNLAIAVLALTALDRAAGEGVAGALARRLLVAPANLVAGRWLTRRAAGRASVPGELAINYLVVARRPAPWPMGRDTPS